MAKVVDVSVADAALTQFKGNTTAMSACGTTPTTMAQATATYSLGTLAIATTVWTIGAGDAANSRKVTLNAAQNVVATASGTVGFVAFWNSGTIMGVATCVPTAISSAGTFTCNGFDFDEIGTIT
jgi:hypothetical protein